VGAVARVPIDAGEPITIYAKGGTINRRLGGFDISPDPTTSTSNFRLFAGLTSFISKWCRSHFFSIGPEGIFASSFTNVRGAI
jgi:hypothetical protein